MSARPSLVSAESTTVTELTGKVSLKNAGEEIAWDDIKKVAQELNKERMGRRFWKRVSAACAFAIVVVFALTLTAVIAGFELTRETNNNKKPHTETVVLETTNGDPISTSITEYSYDETYLCGVLQSDLDAPYPEKIGIDYDDDDGNVHELRMKVGMVERTVADGSDPTATVAAIYSTDGSAAIVLDESGDVYIHRGDAHFATEHVCDAGANRRLQEDLYDDYPWDSLYPQGDAVYKPTMRISSLRPLQPSAKHLIHHDDDVLSPYGTALEGFPSWQVEPEH